MNLPLARLLSAVALLGLPAAPAARAQPAADAASTPVTLTETASDYILANGIVTATVNKRTADLVSLKYRGLELMGYGSGHPAGYWEQDPSRAPKLTDRVTIDPAANGGARAEVSVKGVSEGTMPLGNGPGGGTLCDIEIRYALGRGDSGVYTYAIYTHPAGYPATQIGESRFGAKLNNDVFDWLTIDARHNKLMLTAAAWAHGTPLNMKEARRLTTGIYRGQVEHKYDYSAVQFDTPAYGWSGTRSHVGLWFINPSMEYLSGGPTKVELTGHRDLTASAAPTLLDYWRGTHYGGSECVIPAGEAWDKVVGPILIYCNTGPTPDAMWRDALAQAAAQTAAWPYAWVAGVDYPAKDQRATVRGRLVLDDPAAPGERLSNLLVGLAAPDYQVRGWRGHETTVDWQHDAKHYEFWTRGDAQGRFAIPNVRPGRYTLYAIADGVLGEFARADVAVRPGETLDLGALDWRPVRYGRPLWTIGVPNRSAREFFHGDDYWHWGLYLDYAKWFPHGVRYVVGRSDWRKDWNFEQVPRIAHPDGTGRKHGAATTWTIVFNLLSAPHGLAVLRLALVGVGARRLDVAANGRDAGAVTGLVYNAVINRDGIQGSWVEKDVPFDAALMRAGENTLTLTIPAGSPTSGIMYDCLRLELNESAKPPAN